mgnify:CR=1 FL=1
MADPKLEQLRARIDALDEQLQALLTERASCAKQIAEVKQDGGGEADFYRPEREAEVLRRVRQRNTGPLSDEEVVRLFREIMSACLALEQPLTIAYLGPEGTYTQAAAVKHFGQLRLTRIRPGCNRNNMTDTVVGRQRHDTLDKASGKQPLGCVVKPPQCLFEPGVIGDIGHRAQLPVFSLPSRCSARLSNQASFAG